MADHVRYMVYRVMMEDCRRPERGWCSCEAEGRQGHKGCEDRLAKTHSSLVLAEGLGAENLLDLLSPGPLSV